MSTEDAAREGNAGSGYRQGFYSNQIIPKYPAYGKQLAERIRFKNPPKLVVIEVGGDSWNRAKKWAKHPDFAGIVLTPEADPKRLIWPVCGCLCLVEWDKAAPELLIVELVQSLKMAGALKVAVQPMFVDHDTPSHYFDTDSGTFIQVRECLRIYLSREGVRHAA